MDAPGWVWMWMWYWIGGGFGVEFNLQFYQHTPDVSRLPAGHSRRCNDEFMMSIVGGGDMVINVMNGLDDDNGDEESDGK